MGVSPSDAHASRVWRAQRYLSYPALVFSALLGAVAVSTGWSTWATYRWLLVVAAVAAIWTLLYDTMHPQWENQPRRMVPFYVVRWVLTAVLVVGNPWFGLYAFVGYIDALRFFTWRWAVVGIGATALLTATSQAAGLPDATVVQIGAFTFLWLFNFALATGFSYGGVVMERQSEERRAVIEELVETNKRLEEALAENAGLHAQLLAQAREAGVLDERARLAREIDDTLAQGLTGIVTQLQAAEGADDAERTRRLQTATRLARENLAEARRSVQALRPQELEHADLPTAMSAAVKEWSVDTGVSGQFVTTGTPTRLHPEVEAALLRTAQEALANVAKHAGATRVALTLSYMGDVVSLDVRDDGRGFRPTPNGASANGASANGVPPSESTGFGLTAMRQRLALVAGTLEVESEPGSGTALCAVVPALP